jgi:fatty-acyl-CoA synthase
VELVFVHYAAALAGMILTPFNTGWAAPEIEHALSLASPALLFAGKDSKGRDLGSRARAIADCDVLHLDEIGSCLPGRDVSLPAVQQDDPYLIQFTSGTTGKAKGALLSHRAALLAGWIRPACEGGGDRDVYLNPVPFHHVGGSCAVVLGAASLGGAFVVLEGHDPGILLSLMEPVQATRMGGVPTMWFDLMRREDLPENTCVRTVTLGGAHVPPSLVEQVRSRLGARCAIGYGQSEYAVATGTMPDDPIEVLTETVGRPLPHTELKIVDLSTGCAVAPGETGEIRLRGPACMDRYWGDENATQAAFDAEGFLCTGDLGSMMPDGVCRVHGRVREMIIRGGENIYPAEIENVLLKHPAVAMAAVFGVSDERLGEKVAAAVTLRPGAQIEPDRLREHVARSVSHFKVPVMWKILDAFPCTASGKVRKAELAKMMTEE